MTNRRVVITGASGSIGSLITTRLRDRWRIDATDVRPGHAVRLLDITDATGCREACHGADAVVHLAADADPDSDWMALRGPNVDGAYTIAAAARECGVRRLVLASSLQAVSAISPDVQRRAGDPPRPANLYGATKAWAEALGSWVAASSETSVVALRIGFHPGGAPPPGTSLRDRSGWLSADDCVRLVTAAVEATVGGFTVVNGISANRPRLAELGDAERALGYAPRDDAFSAPRSGPRARA